MEPEIGGSSVIERFVTLLGICQRINSEKNFDELLNLIAVEAAKLVDAERATIFIYDSEAGQLWAKVATGTEEIIRFDSRQGVAGAVMKARKTIAVEDAYDSPYFYPAVDSQTGFVTRNILGVPIENYRGEIVGVFQVLNKLDGPFTSEDEQFVEALASQSAVALENARQLEKLELERRKLLRENSSLRQAVEGRFSARNILGTSERMESIRRMIDKVAAADVSVLVTGENGTGKELVARAIHHGGSRSSGPFVAVNCAALPESLVEAELFGIEKGVATGVERRVGRIQSASGGTLFLDEIGDLSLEAQAKLLRVLQEREVEWVGGRKPVAVDIRLIAATNKDLAKAIDDGAFRQDLYFRLNTVGLSMPALGEIRGDIPLLAMHFLQKHRSEIGAKAERFSGDAMRAMTTYAWPGNVRELENEVKRALVLTSGAVIEARDLSDAVQSGVPIPESMRTGSAFSGRQHSLKERVAALEIEMVRAALTETGGDRRKAARCLGLSHQGLLNKIKRYGLG